MLQTCSIHEDGTTIQYLAQGDGYPMLVLPSLGRGPHDYDTLAVLLAQRGFRVIRPFPRGLGGSVGPQAETLHDYARDIAAVIRREGRPDAIVAGHALGNFIARTTAADFPDLVRGVALLAASAGKAAPGEQSIAEDILHAVYESGNLDLSDAQRLVHLRKAFFAPGNDPSVWLAGWHPDVKAEQACAWRATPVDAYFAAGTAPLLDLQAAQDTVAPRRLSHILKQALGDRVTVAVIENAGHALIPEQPHAVADALGDWAHALLDARSRAAKEA